MNNLLIHADNLRALDFLLGGKNLRGKVDLVYIDPPFATNHSFGVTAERAATISRARDAQIAYADNIIGADFIAYLRRRLLLLRALLSPQGSIYVHTDDKIGHYVKVMMDEVFGAANFRNAIARIKCNPKNFPRAGYGNIKDMVLFYTRGAKPIWREPKEAYDAEDLIKLFPKINAQGRRYTTVPIHAPGETQRGATRKKFRGASPPPGRHWRADVATLEAWDAQGLLEWSARGNPRKILFADEQEGKRMQDIWRFKDPQHAAYPTEKNAAMLDLIVGASSNPGGIVLDCFCGSGTALLAAARAERRWIGVDESAAAIRAAAKKLAREPVFGNYDFLDLRERENPTAACG